MLGKNDRPWPVAIFAHNEAKNIVDCLQSIIKASKRHSILAFVIANGCNDDTEKLVRKFADNYSWIKLCSIAIADKANAWNVFVHDLAPPHAEVCFFTDGDVRVSSGGFDALSSALLSSPAANGAAAIPSTGRSKQGLEKLVCREHLMLGGLYALRGEFLCRVKNYGVRMPVGYIGEDSLLTSLVKWDLNPKGPFLHHRVVPCPDASFSYHSLSPLKIPNWKTFLHRSVRYSLRHFQDQLLFSLLVRDGIEKIPNTTSDLYTMEQDGFVSISPRLGPNVLFDIIAIHQMRKTIKVS